MHKSIFVIIKDYNSNPVAEYTKLLSFLSNKTCYEYYGSFSVFDLFRDYFGYCESLRPIYEDFDDCLNKNISMLNDYKEVYDFNSIDEKIQENLLDEFLTFCEIVGCMFKVITKTFVKFHLHDRDFNQKIFEQAIEMLNTSLKSINYALSDNDENDEVEVIKINPIAEYVASQAKPNLREAIVAYLGARDSDPFDKESKLHLIIDLIEPILAKYHTQESIGKVKEFVQLIRHPEIYKEKKEYNWFFEDKSKYLDDIFDMCIFVVQFANSKVTITKFTDNKTKVN